MPEQFDVFLCHNSQDKTEVKKIAEQLRQAGIKPWLDVWELRPGLSWQKLLEEQIKGIKSAAVFVGSSGLGPWQEEEMRAFLSQFVQRNCPVIPTLLPDATQQPELPIFLQDKTWVDFRQSDPEPMEQLIWGITGKKRDKANQAGQLYPPPQRPHYGTIIDAFSFGIDPNTYSGVIPFLGAGVNLCDPLPISPIEIASELAKPYNNSENLIGVPCSVCPLPLKKWSTDNWSIPEECPILEKIKTDVIEGQPIDPRTCSLSKEQRLALAKINLRLLSQFYRLSTGDSGMLYQKIHRLFDERVFDESIFDENKCQYNRVHHFLATLPKKLKEKGYKELPYQLILTTNYDDRLESAFRYEEQPFDVIFYIAEGEGHGQFKHKTYEEVCQDKEGEIIEDGYNRPLPWKQYPIILKLYGTWKDKFVITEEHHINYLNYLSLSKVLPAKLLSVITEVDNQILLLGYSLSDPDLELILHRFSEAQEELKGNFFIVHQSKPGSLEKRLWAKRKVAEDQCIRSSLEDCIKQLNKGIEELPYNSASSQPSDYHPSDSDLPVVNPSAQQRLKDKIVASQQQWDLLSKKLDELNKQFILENRSDEKLRLRYLIDDTETQRDQVEKKLKDMETNLSRLID